MTNTFIPYIISSNLAGCCDYSKLCLNYPIAKISYTFKLFFIIFKPFCAVLKLTIRFKLINDLLMNYKLKYDFFKMVSDVKEKIKTNQN